MPYNNKATKRKKEKRDVQTQGGAFIGGSVNTGGGDLVGRDKVVHESDHRVEISGNVFGSTIVTGDQNRVNTTRILFSPIYRHIDRSERLPQEKADLATEVQEVEMEVQKGEAANEDFLSRRLRALKRMAPDIGELLLSALSGPGAVISTLVRKVAKKVKAQPD
jgi:uncharacterized protein (UPF0335 family)